MLHNEKENAQAWMRVAASFMHQPQWEDEKYQVLAVHSEILERELTENVQESLYVLPYAAGLLVCFLTMNGFVLTGRKWYSKWNLMGLQNFLVLK